MDTLTTTSVSTVTRGVAMQWKPRFGVLVSVAAVTVVAVLVDADCCAAPVTSLFLAIVYNLILDAAI